MIEHKQIFIDGKWVDSSGRESLNVVNPVTEESDRDGAARHGGGRRSRRASCVEGISELVAVLGRDTSRDLQEARPPDRSARARDHAHDRQRAGLPGCAGRQVAGSRRRGGARPHRRSWWARSFGSSRSVTRRCTASRRAYSARSRPGTGRCARSSPRRALQSRPDARSCSSPRRSRRSPPSCSPKCAPRPACRPAYSTWSAARVRRSARRSRRIPWSTWCR